MYIRLKERQFYEDIYDRHTIEDGRRNQATFDEMYDDFFKKFPNEEPKRYGVILHMNIFYMAFVGNNLLDRYDKREEYIHDWMAKDEAKDQRIASARLGTEPLCQHCSKTGLRIIDKSFMHCGEDYKYDDPEEVLFMLKCTHCEKTSAYWEDGSEWERRHTYCSKCKAIMNEEDSRCGKVITTTYSCPNCSHSYKDKLDLKPKKEVVDPGLEKDKEIYCLRNKMIRDELQDMRYRMEEMTRLGKEFKEKEDNKHIYDAMAELKKPKITELAPLLALALEKAGYIEFSLDKPEMGKDVYVGFSCLDSKSDREDYDSRKTLRKLVNEVLINTNWRLMSDGISYRLGYLNGRIRAFEREEDLKELVIKRGRLKPKQTNTKTDTKKNAYTIKGKNGETISL
jgi:hypothetical protein